MSYIIRVLNEGDKKRVYAYHLNPEKLSNEQKEGTIEVDEIPVINNKQGKYGLRYYDEDTNSVYIEYFDEQ